MRSLGGRVAIVTGGARGIGAGVVRRLAADGASVVVADIDADSAQAVATGVRDSGGEATAVAVDLADEVSIVALVAATIDKYGAIDVVDNNAALTDADVLSIDADVTTIDAETWDRTFAVNLRSQFLMAKHVVPHMERRGRGSIINMSSGAALKGDLTRTAYSASKAGIESLTRSIATQHGRAGVRANTIVPGLILTKAARDGIPADLLARYTTKTRTPYVGGPDDVAGLVAFLASDDSRYITGQTIVIDGGMSVHSASLPGLVPE
ncbi:MAG TPA: SDR family NAD(P)-dependent oxidoreductase [Mycobacteriales bacterium]|nr:SDR family NAD(P)-dependent oxidoreductase [Mycobacteriales bacterium]